MSIEKDSLTDEETVYDSDQPSSPESSEHSDVNKRGYGTWIDAGNNKYVPSEIIITTDKVVPSKYKIAWDGNYGRNCLVKENINSDELLELPSPIFKSILNDINFFWNNKALFEKYKYIHKRGILLFGTAGCGKSSICTLLSNQVIEKGGIVLSVNNTSALEKYDEFMSEIFRFIEPNTNILTIFEDLDGLIRNSEYETMLLNILDGNNQLNNVVNVACTNYPEKLKDRILNRPSRFDRRYEIGLPNAEIREYYLKNKIRNEDINEKTLKYIVNKTEGLTIAHLGEFIKSVYIFGENIDDTIILLKGMSEYISSKSNMKGKNIGFGQESTTSS